MINELNDQNMLLHLLVVYSIAQSEELGDIATNLPAPFRTNGVIIWKVAFEILWEVFTSNDSQLKEMSWAQRISEVACLRSKDASLLPPILFYNPEHLGTSCLDSMVGLIFTEIDVSG